MDSSKAPLTGQEPTSWPNADDEIVDLSGNEEVIVEPPLEKQLAHSSPVKDQVMNQPVVTRQAEALRMEQRRPTYGSQLAVRYCPQCGRPVPPGALFCPSCGRALDARQLQGVKTQKLVTPSPHAMPPKQPIAPKQPKKRRSGWRLLLVGVAALVAAAVVFEVYSQGSINIPTVLKTKSTTTAVPVPTQATPSVTVRTTPVGTQSVTTGALILLNPGVVRQGVSMGVDGSGFDPRTGIDLFIKQTRADSGQPIGTARTDRYGNFYGNVTVPETLGSGTFFMEAREHGGNKVALAAGVIAGGAPQLKLSEQVGKPGDQITVSLHGFSPQETIKVYWNTMVGQPITTLQADSSGGIGQATVQVPFGAAGINTFLFVGARSLSMVAASFDLLSLYPTVKLSNYAIRAANQLNFSGSGFGPGERVLVYLNSTAGQPLAVVQTSQKGNFANAPGFVVPFSLKGRQTLIFLGEESRASVAVAWTVQPYMPFAQASTYGGLPGTTISFYGYGFARQEVVHVYIGHTQNNAGNMVSCFRTDDRGSAVAAGSYVIPGNAQGKLTFTLVGVKSGGVATATMSITAPPVPVQVPPQPPFTCPLDNGTP
jgi:predicted nucleic acid-binding Zn ribbon protein